jgi:hypothetical protein
VATKYLSYDQVSTPGYKGQFNYVAPTLAPKPVDPTSIHDVPTLNKALKTKQINQNQWNQRFKTISGNTGPTVKPTLGAAINHALNTVIAQPSKKAATAVVRPIADVATGKGGKAVHDTAQLGRDVGVQQSVKSAARIGPNAAIIGTNLLLRGAGSNKVVTPKSLGKNSQVGHLANVSGATGKNKQFVSDVAQTAAQVVGPEEGVAAKGLAERGVAKLTGKEAAEKLATNSRVASALTKAKAANAGDDLAKTAVADASKPTVTKIPVTGESTAVKGKVSTVSDSAYIKKSNQLSKNYEAELARIKTVPHPVTQQVLQRQLDDKYTKLQADLDTAAGKTSVGFNGKPAKAPQLPKSALHPDGNVEPPTFGEQTAPTASTKPTEAPTATTPKASKAVTTGTPKVSGSASRTEQAAVEAGMKGEFGDKATFKQVSHKEQAAKAVQLLKDNPQKAEDIAMGRVAGDNVSHESAVYHAVKNQALADAKRTGDFSKVQALASSPRHSVVSEAAQRLGAEGHNLDTHDPVRILNDIAKSREKSVGKRLSTNISSEAEGISKEVKATAPKVTRQDWHSFIQELQCK